MAATLLHTFKSRSERGVKHKVTRGDDGKVRCSCKGFRYGGKCWHTAEYPPHTKAKVERPPQIKVEFYWKREGVWKSACGTYRIKLDWATRQYVLTVRDDRQWVFIDAYEGFDGAKHEATKLARRAERQARRQAG